MAMCLTIRPSQRIDMAASVRAISCAAYSRRCCGCIREGLVGGEGFAVDASLIKADANRQNGVEGQKGLPSEATGHAIDEYLAVLDDAAFGGATEVTPKLFGLGGTSRAPRRWRPFAKFIAGGAGARPDHPITGQW
jgi:hypothetical protein